MEISRDVLVPHAPGRNVRGVSTQFCVDNCFRTHLEQTPNHHHRLSHRTINRVLDPPTEQKKATRLKEAKREMAGRIEDLKANAEDWRNQAAALTAPNTEQIRLLAAITEEQTIEGQANEPEPRRRWWPWGK